MPVPETEMNVLDDRIVLVDQLTDVVLTEQRAKIKNQHNKQYHGEDILPRDCVLLSNPAVPVDRCRKIHLS